MPFSVTGFYFGLVPGGLFNFYILSFYVLVSYCIAAASLGQVEVLEGIVSPSAVE